MFKAYSVFLNGKRVARNVEVELKNGVICIINFDISDYYGYKYYDRMDD